MVFFKRKSVNVKNVYVATTTITSSYNDGNGCGPRCVTWYFLVKLKHDKYYELFAGKHLEKEEDTHENGMIYAHFDTPYIEKVEPLAKYLTNSFKKKMSIQLLFDFITDMNVLNSLGAFDDNEDDDETEGEENLEDDDEYDGNFEN